MPPPNRCPDRTTLGRLIEGELDDSLTNQLTEHVDCCTKCLAVVEQFGRQGEKGLDPTGDLEQAESFPECDTLVRKLIRIARGETLARPSGPTIPDVPVPERLEHFCINGVLGSGGMGTVYLAWDTRLKRQVAIKQLRPILVESRKLQQRILREARAAARIRHPGVVAVHSVHEEYAPPFFVMEYVKGVSLQARLDDQGVLSVSETLKITLDILAALNAAQSENVIHCDIKPANVLLDAATNHARLTDFGISRAATTCERDRQEYYLGTPHYMSPEQCDARPLDSRNDLYSLGVMIYRMLSGTLPFDATNIKELRSSILHEQPIPLRQHCPATPLWLSALVQQLMEKCPDDRPISAANVLDQINAFQTNRPRQWTRSAVWTGLAGISILTLMAYSTGWIAFTNRDRATTPDKSTNLSRPAILRSDREFDDLPFYLGNREASLPILDEDPSAKIRIVQSGWKLVHSFRVAGKVRSAKFCPLDGSIWFCHVQTKTKGGVYRIGTQRPVEQDSLTVLHAKQRPSPEAWQYVDRANLIQSLPRCHVLEFHPSGTHFALQFGKDGLVVLRKTLTGEQIGAYQCRLDGDNDPYAIAFLSDAFRNPLADPGDILTVDYGYPSSVGSLWKCTPGNALCTQIGSPDWLHSPTDLAADDSEIFVCQRASEFIDDHDHPNHYNQRLFRVLPDRYEPIVTEQRIRLAEGMVLDPISGGLFVTTRNPTELVYVDLLADQEIKPIRLMATGFEDLRNDSIDISADGRYILVSDLSAGTLHVIARAQSDHSQPK